MLITLFPQLIVLGGGGGGGGGADKKESFDAVMSLKNNNAAGFDSVSNEMLKCGFNQLHNCLIKVFKNIFS